MRSPRKGAEQRRAAEVRERDPGAEAAPLPYLKELLLVLASSLWHLSQRLSLPPASALCSHQFLFNTFLMYLGLSMILLFLLSQVSIWMTEQGFNLFTGVHAAYLL